MEWGFRKASGSLLQSPLQTAHEYCAFRNWWRAPGQLLAIGVREIHHIHWSEYGDKKEWCEEVSQKEFSHLGAQASLKVRSEERSEVRWKDRIEGGAEERFEVWRQDGVETLWNDERQIGGKARADRAARRQALHATHGERCIREEPGRCRQVA